MKIRVLKTRRLEDYKVYFDYILSVASSREISIAEEFKSYFMLIGKYVPNKIPEITEFNDFCLSSGYDSNGFYTTYVDYRAGENVFTDIIYKEADDYEEEELG